MNGVFLGNELTFSDDAALVLELLLGLFDSLIDFLGISLRLVRIDPTSHQIFGVVEFVILILLCHNLLGLLEFTFQNKVNMRADFALLVDTGSHVIVDLLEMVVETTQVGFGPICKNGAAHVKLDHFVDIDHLDFAEASIVVSPVHDCEKRRCYALYGGSARLVVD